MSATAALFVLVFFGLMLMAVVRDPLWGLVGYFWVFYRNPPTQWWGQGLPDLRWSLLAAVVTSAAVLGRRLLAPNASERTTAIPGRWRFRVPIWLTLALAAWMWLQMGWAISTDAHLEGCILFTKYVILLALIQHLVTTRERMQAMFWCHVVGCAIWGWIAFTSNVSGRLEISLHPEGADSNLIGYHMVTGLAFAGVLLFTARGWRRLLALLSIPFVLNVVILSASRSATLSMVAAGGGAALFAPRRLRWAVFGAMLLAVPLFLRLAGSELYWDRMDTLRQTDQENMEGSAASRGPIMAAEWRMFLDHPLGVGYRCNQLLSPLYIPDYLMTTDDNGNRVRAAHNSFMAYLVDQGVVGALFFVAMELWAFISLLRLRPPDTTLGAYRMALMAGLLAHFTSGLFINIEKTESWFWMLALTSVLCQLCATEQRPASTVEANESQSLHGPWRAAVVTG